MKSTDTKPHLLLQQAIELAGFSCATEVEFPPYTVDCYIEEAHLALEADGEPWHSKIRDAKRDEYLYQQYDLLVIRISSIVLKKSNLRKIVKIIQGVVIHEYERKHKTAGNN